MLRTSFRTSCLITAVSFNGKTECEERDADGRFELSETARRGSREALSDASARREAGIPATKHRAADGGESRGSGEKSSGNENGRTRQARSATRRIRPEMPYADTIEAAAGRTEAARDEMRDNAPRGCTRVRRAGAVSCRPSGRHREHGCLDRVRVLTGKQAGKLFDGLKV